MSVVDTTKIKINPKQIFAIAKNNTLFQEITFRDFEQISRCLSAKIRCYKKNEIILLTGNTIDFVGLILSGSVKVIKEAADGRATIIIELPASKSFGETLACAEITQSPVTVLAAKDTELLSLDYKKIINSCSASCLFHTRLIKNMLKRVAQKNLLLEKKLEIFSLRTTRERLLCFFELQKSTAEKFTIPFNREELAQYLSVDRSALSNELSKMRSEGLIRFQKNTFELL